MFEYKADRLEHSDLEIKNDKLSIAFQVMFSQSSWNTIFSGSIYNIQSSDNGINWSTPKTIYRNYNSPGINPDIDMTNTDTLMVMEKENQVFFMKGKFK